MIEVTLEDGTIVQFADGTSQDEILEQLAKLDAGGGETVTEAAADADLLRIPGLAAAGLTDSVLNAIGGIPDLAAAGLRKVGAPAPQNPRFYRDALQSGYRAIADALAAPVRSSLPDLGTTTPRNTFEKAVYGAGRGVGDAATFMVPGAALNKLAQAGSLPQRVGQVLVTSPAMQSAAGAVGGAVTEASDNPFAGIAAALATPFAAQGVRRLATPIAPQSAPRQRVVDAAKQAGIKLTPGQETGSRPLQYLESVFADLPLTSGPQQRIFDEQRKVLNRQAMATTGIDADDASPETLDKAYKVLGERFEELADDSKILLDPQFFDDVKSIAANYSRRLSTDIKPVFKSYVDDIMNLKKIVDENPQKSFGMDGKTYRVIGTDLRNAARRTNDDSLSDALLGLVNSLDNLMTRNVAPEIAAGWREARNQYRNLKTIDKAMQGGTQAERTAGDIPLAGLRSAVRAADPNTYSRGGRGDNTLNQLSRIGDMLGASRPPNSGTPMRTLIQNALTYGPSIGTLPTMDPATMATAAGVSLGGPRVAQGLYNLSSGYLTNQAFPRRPLDPGLFRAIGIERTPSLFDD